MLVLIYEKQSSKIIINLQCLHMEDTLVEYNMNLWYWSELNI